MKLKDFPTLQQKWATKDDDMSTLIGLMFLPIPLLFIVTDIISFCDKRGMPVVITRTVDNMIPGVSKTNTHAEGRAVDFRVFEWKASDRDALLEYINNKYASAYGTGPAGMPPKALIYEDGQTRGTGPHLHAQIRRGL